MKLINFSLSIVCFLIIYSCAVKPEPIKYGKDNCAYCKMTISDSHFGTELITKKGKIYKFDEIGCMLAYAYEQEIDTTKIKTMYISDYCGQNILHDKNSMFFLMSDSLKSPMGGNIASFSNIDSLKNYSSKIFGKIIPWNEVLKNSIEE